MFNTFFSIEHNIKEPNLINNIFNTPPPLKFYTPSPKKMPPIFPRKALRKPARTDPHRIIPSDASIFKAREKRRLIRRAVKFHFLPGRLKCPLFIIASGRRALVARDGNGRKKAATCVRNVYTRINFATLLVYEMPRLRDARSLRERICICASERGAGGGGCGVAAPD